MSLAGKLKAYRYCIRTTQLLLQSISIGLGNTGLVGIIEADNSAQAQESRNENTEVEETLAGGDVGILLRAEDTENFVLFVDGLAEVALLLLVPPTTIGVSERALHTRRVLVAIVLPLPSENHHCTVAR